MPLRFCTLPCETTVAVGMLGLCRFSGNNSSIQNLRIGNRTPFGVQRRNQPISLWRTTREFYFRHTGWPRKHCEQQGGVRRWTPGEYRHKRLMAFWIWVWIDKDFVLGRLGQSTGAYNQIKISYNSEIDSCVIKLSNRRPCVLRQMFLTSFLSKENFRGAVFLVKNDPPSNTAWLPNSWRQLQWVIWGRYGRQTNRDNPKL